MISRLSHASLSFKANEPAISPREAYDSKLAQNSQIAQNQNRIIQNLPATKNNQVPMQGSGQKLDVIA